MVTSPYLSGIKHTPEPTAMLHRYLLLAAVFVTSLARAQAQDGTEDDTFERLYLSSYAAEFLEMNPQTGMFAYSMTSPITHVWCRDGDGGGVGFDLMPQCGQYASASSLLPQTDGKVLLFGVFPNYTGVWAPGTLLRFQPNGRVDTSFHPPAIVFDSMQMSPALLQRPDGRYILLGKIPSLGSDTTDRSGIQLMPDGAWDPSFSLPAKVNFNTLYRPVLADDGSVFAVGTWGSTMSRSIYFRIRTDGSLDTNLQIRGTERVVLALRSGKFLKTDSGITRLYRADGSLDTDTPFSTDLFNVLAELPDGRFIASKGVPAPLGSPFWHNLILRLTATGEVDSSFTPFRLPDCLGRQECFVQPSGKLVIVSHSIRYPDTQMPIYRLHNTLLTATEKRGAQARLQPSPVPARGGITLQADVPLGTIRIRNSVGVQVWQTMTTARRTQLELPSLPPGLYTAEAAGTQRRFVLE